MGTKSGLSIVLPIISHASIAPLTTVASDSPADFLHVEFRAALALQTAGKLQCTFPITVGPRESLGSLGVPARRP